MKLNATTSKACKIAVALKGGERLSAQRIAEEIGRSKKSLEDALVDLSRAGIIIGKRGCKGGYIMVKDSITLLDIIDTTEGTYFTCRLLSKAIRETLNRYGPEDGI